MFFLKKRFTFEQTNRMLKVMKKVILICFSMLPLLFFGQTYKVGHKQITFIDPDRNNRSIQTEIYYPSSTAGDNVAISSGQFPVLIFGHGFVMGWDSYQWLWDSIVPMGYIMAFPRTEGSISPSHTNFGLDLRFLNEKFKTENTSSSSFFYQHIANTSAIMGHSMGGGSSFLAAENYTNFTTLINFAAATTNPSSITAASHVTVPLLMFIGENDGVAKPADHQIPMYDSCLSSCKTRVTIKGGGHCYFAGYNFNCSFGESTTSPQPTITREEQQSRVWYLLRPYINFMLKGNASEGVLFLSRLTNNSDITYVRSCNTLVNGENFNKGLVYPNPVSEQLNVYLPQNEGKIKYSIVDIMGYELLNGTLYNNLESISVENLNNGIYFLRLFNDFEQTNIKFIKK